MYNILNTLGHEFLFEDLVRADNCRLNVSSNCEYLDLEGLTGRFFSSSYTPAQGTEGYRIQSQKLTHHFEKTSINGFVEFRYSTQVFLGKMMR